MVWLKIAKRYIQKIYYSKSVRVCWTELSANLLRPCRAFSHPQTIVNINKHIKFNGESKSVIHWCNTLDLFPTSWFMSVSSVLALDAICLSLSHMHRITWSIYVSQIALGITEYCFVVGVIHFIIPFGCFNLASMHCHLVVMSDRCGIYRFIIVPYTWWKICW